MQVKEILKPFQQGFCLRCKYKENANCTKNLLYGRPVPVFCVESCNFFEDSTTGKKSVGCSDAYKKG